MWSATTYAAITAARSWQWGKGVLIFGYLCLLVGNAAEKLLGWRCAVISVRDALRGFSRSWGRSFSFIFNWSWGVATTVVASLRFHYCSPKQKRGRNGNPSHLLEPHEYWHGQRHVYSGYL